MEATKISIQCGMKKLVFHTYSGIQLSGKDETLPVAAPWRHLKMVITSKSVGQRETMSISLTGGIYTSIEWVSFWNRCGHRGQSLKLPKEKVQKEGYYRSFWLEHTLMHMYHLDNKHTPTVCSGHCTQLSVITSTGKKNWKRINRCIYITESGCSPPKSNTIL